MRKLAILMSVLIASQLTACATQGYQGYQGSSNSPYPSNYQTPYPVQNQTYPNQYAQPSYPQYSQGYQAPAYVEVATIVAMREVGQANNNQAGAGALVGAVLGGVLGHQVGKGDGRDLATLGGAIAGGIVGNEVERNNAPQRVKTEITLRMPNGEQRALLIEPGSYYRIGDRIKVIHQNGQLNIVQ
ncbi:glycine zipper 2TM domain-containing protein [Undibacterium sp. Jales W-56]|uniref:glycine zipper 2TM domain-containing protein n=1 Tax=Undibacterium sp. Jales W-56 TaxID=2897325 RepID=UPI0021CFD601|nr:glycine zipper 2TM domain-containing protein [Undibacterium sp. Jales W-56]MCU6435601.1 glycine zipper 2TM domain-containing protein [Undibacterium sp. Jales W-56]